MIVKVLVFVVFYIVWVMGSLSVIFGIFTDPKHPGDIPFIAIVLYLVAIMIPVVLFNRWGIKPRWVEKVRSNGKLAPATIVSVTDTAMRINYRQISKIKLRVEPRFPKSSCGLSRPVKNPLKLRWKIRGLADPLPEKFR